MAKNNLLIISILLSVTLFGTYIIHTKKNNSLPDISGKLLYHTYSSYNANDSKLYIFDFDTKTKTCISDKFPSVINPMNGCFNSSGTEITFMGIENDQWHVYTYNLETNELCNLTGESNLRSEDPKYSFDDKKIVFKQEYWSETHNTMLYDIKEIDLATKEITCLTEDTFENSMPCYSYDGNDVFYAQSHNESSSIYKIDKSSKNLKTEVFSSTDLKAYYPIASKNYLYFSRAFSKSNSSDIIMRLDLATKSLESLPFNSSRFNCSDAYPISDKYILISSTMESSKGGYDLYIGDAETGKTYSLDLYLNGINDKNHQLGAYYNP